MSFSGDLRGIGLGDVFQNIAQNRLTGTLLVRARQTERFVRFTDGRVTGFSLGVGKGLPMLGHLRERGWVDDKQVDRLLQKHRRSRKSACRLILEAKLLGDDDLRAALRELVEEQVYDLILLREAWYEFTDGDPPARVFDSDQKALGVDLEIGPLLMESARRKDELERIQKVVSSDLDTFVLLEGWEELELDDAAAAVAPLLDGRSDVRALVQALGLSRFAVTKAVSDLVREGVARPITLQELEELAADAVEAGDHEEALRLLAAALSRERQNRELRQQYAELLATVGRAKDAAAEYAQLGHQTALADEIDEALAFYDHAVEQDPRDLPLQERRLELLRQAGDDAIVKQRVLELVEMQSEMGLADRARTTLAQTVAGRGLGRDPDLLERLAELDASLGDPEASARTWRRLGDAFLAQDEARGLYYLRRALEQGPDDEALAVRIDDIESGRQQRRRSRRRRLGAFAAAGSVVVALGLVGVAEINASRQLATALGRGLGPLRDGEGVDALLGLSRVEHGYAWTGSGRRATQLVERVLDLQLAAVEELLQRSDYARATRVLERLVAEVERPDLAATCRVLLGRAQIEQEAFLVLRRADRDGNAPSVQDLALLQGLTDPGYLDFHLAHLPRVRSEAARQSLLQALTAIDSPRVFAPIARLALRVDDARSLDLIQRILARAAAHRARGHESDWAMVYPELEAALSQPRTRGPAQLALRLLQGG